MPLDATTPVHVDSVLPANPTGVPVLCIHGMFAGSWVFDELLPMIADRGYPAHALSLRGHPPNEALRSIGSRSMSDYGHDAAEVARRLDRPIVIAHSMGGLIAMMLAARNQVRAAVLVSPAPARGISVVSPLLFRRMPRYFPAMLLSRPFSMTDADADTLALNRLSPAARLVVRNRFVPDSGRAARQMALGVFKVPARAVRAPLLVVGPEDDQFIPVGVARRVAAKYGAQLHIAKGHGHFFFGEPGWKEHAAIMLDWIDALPRAIRDPRHEIRAANRPITRAQ